MPKKEIDYSNTIIYKIICKDQNITDIYVGHTTNFVQRKYSHKQGCINKKSINYSCKLYKIIRENGGWNNWNMIMLNFYKCKDGNEARQKEQEYYEKLNANLNSVEPFIVKEPKIEIVKPIIEKKIYYCDKCNIYTKTQRQLDTHFQTSKHKKLNDASMASENASENASEKCPNAFRCKCCDYTCFKQSVYDKHISTRKHDRLVNASKGIFLENLWSCNCGKNFKHDSSLYRHKKKCNYMDEENNNNENKIITSNEISNDVILKLVDENSDIKKMLFKQFESMQEQQIQIQNQMIEHQKQISELIPKVGNNNSTINNNVKQKFNINIFLNEQCKDALTMNEFINKIKVTLDDLMITKNKGISEGVSNIFIENMNKLSVHERPIHCTDVKRETVYIKCDSNSEGSGISYWEKDEQNKKLKNALDKVTRVQNNSLSKWIEKHPNWENNSDEQDEYMRLIKNCTDDLNENKREEKVIKKLCNEVYLKGTESL